MYLSKVTINILLAVAISVLGIGVWIGQAQKEAADYEKNVISHIDPNQITEITISDATTIKAKLEKRNGTWRMTQPFNIEANSFLANKLTKILSSKFSKTFTAGETNLQEFGLSPPLFTLKLNEHKLFFGERSAISNNRYIGFNNQLYLIRDQLLPVLNSAPASFVSHKLIPNSAKIVSLELPDLSIKQQNNNWLLSTSTTLSSQTSQDSFVKLLDEWRLAQALYISFDDDQPSVNTPTSLVRFADGSQIQFFINKNESSLIFYRPDPGIFYHMHNEAEKNLLALPLPEIETAP